MKQINLIYKTQGNCGLFVSKENLAKMSKFGNLLERLSKVIDFNIFQETLEKGC